MHIILAMVMSVDGKTTKWHDPHLHTWTSPEDQKYFSELIEKHTLIIMGRKTYEAAKPMMKHIPGKLRVILTNNPQQYSNVTIFGQLEFTKEHPTSLIKRLEQKGYREGLLVGGEHTNALFLQENLVNELWLTLEPRLFGSGNGLVAETNLGVNLKLLSLKKLNNKGTLLLKYTVVQ